MKRLENLWHVPTEMREWPTVPYRLMPRGNGRLGKVPIGEDGRPCNHRDPRHHQAYGDVVARVEAGEADGLGIVLPEDAVMLDVDDCMVGGRMDDGTKALLERLDSYTEISQSRRGVKAFARGQKPGTRSRGNGIELYGPSQYAALTGDVYGPVTEVREAQQAIESIYNQMFGPPTSEIRPQVRPGGALGHPIDLEDIIQRARHAKNGVKFTTLFDAGDISGYPSHSEADMALLKLLRFWVGDDAALLDALMRRSALMRDKWAPPYATRTITRVISRGGPVWRGRR